MLRSRCSVFGGGCQGQLYLGRGGRGLLGGGPGQGGNCEGRWAGMLIVCERKNLGALDVMFEEIEIDDKAVSKGRRPDI